MKKQRKSPARRVKKETVSPSLIAVFPGSFDPFTNGHADIVERALTIFTKIVIGVLDNPAKRELFTAKERVNLIKKLTAAYGEKVEVQSFSGLLVDFVSGWDSRVVIRGLRAISDFDYEAQMALMNRRLNSNIETLFLMAREKNSYISSTVVKQVARFGGDVGAMVPPKVAEALKAKLKKR